MRSLTLALTAATAAFSMPAQGDVLYYRFDAASGAASTRVVNFVAGIGTAPDEAGLANGSAGIGAGRFGRGLIATRSGAPNSVDTNWTPAITGSFTIAMFVKNRYANDPLARATLFGESGGFRGDVGATAQGGFVLSGWGGQDLAIEDGLPWCMVNGWTHVAVVVDTGANQATLYRGGAAVASVALPGTPVIVPQSTLILGDDGTARSPSLFDIDEARVVLRAATPSEVMEWATSPSAVVAPWGTASGVQLSPTGGLPEAGNSSFGFEVAGAASAPCVLVLGWGRRYEDLGALLGTPQAGYLHVNIDAPVGLLLDSSGLAAASIPVPAGLTSGEFFAQAFTFGDELRSSAGVACGFGPGN